MADDIIPEGYATAEAFLDEARERFQEAVEADRDNREAGLDDLRFAAGEQWDVAVQAERRRRGRPCLTINTLPQYVGQVIGDTRANQPSIKVRPAQDADVETAKVRQGLIRFIENASNAAQVYALAGEDQVTCGIGHFRVSLAYATDDSFDQDVKIEHIANPFAVTWDAASVEPTGADAQFCFVTDDVDRKAFERAYPDATSSELMAPLETAGWATRDTVRVTEYWTLKERLRTLALLQRAPNAAPSIEDITDDEGAAAFVVKDDSGRPRVRQAVRRSAVMHLITGREILEGPFELPIHRLPVFKVSGREVRVGERRYRFGLIRFAKDAIRMKNLWRSSAAEWLAMAPKQQWLLHETDEKRANRFRAAHRSDDPVLVWSGAAPPERVAPPSAPSALLNEAQFCDQDIKDVTGLHDASLGMRSNETSGTAIMARERQGDVATFMYHDNLSGSIREAGRVINDLLPIVYDNARTVMIVGEDDTATPWRINDPSHPQAVDLKTGKYDIVVETGPSFSTKRVEAAQSMLAFFQAVPEAGRAAGDLLAKAQDWPMADAIAERLQRTLPPNLTAPAPPPGTPAPGGPPPPSPAQMQAAQIARQMAMQKAQLELAEQAARTDQARALAAKAQAEAQLRISQLNGGSTAGQSAQPTADQVGLPPIPLDYNSKPIDPSQQGEMDRKVDGYTAALISALDKIGPSDLAYDSAQALKDSINTTPVYQRIVQGSDPTVVGYTPGNSTMVIDPGNIEAQSRLLNDLNKGHENDLATNFGGGVIAHELGGHIRDQNSRPAGAPPMTRQERMASEVNAYQLEQSVHRAMGITTALNPEGTKNYPGPMTPAQLRQVVYDAAKADVDKSYGPERPSLPKR